MRYGTVCSGIEAPSVAWHPLQWQPVFFSEIEKFPSAVLAHHYPEVPNHGDMLRFKEWKNEPVDLICGGTPCQSFSVAGLRKGLADPRGNLTLTYLAILERERPTWMVWENVPGVLSDKTGAFGSFLGGLGQLGYGFAYRVLDAQYFGVPQRRRRVFVVGCLGNWRAAAAVLFERHSLQGNTAPSRETRQRTSPTVTSGPPFSRTGGEHVEADALINTFECGGTGRYSSSSSSPILNSGADLGHGCEALVMSSGQTNAEITVERRTTLNCDHEAPIVAFKPSHFTRGKDGAPSDVAFPLSADADADKGDQDTVVMVPTLTSNGDAHSGFRDEHGLGPVHAHPIAFESRFVRNGRGAPSDIVPPLKAQSGQSGKGDAAPLVAFEPRYYTRDNKTGGRPSNTVSLNRDTKAGDSQPHVATNMQVRRLTPRECERLQGFPDDYTLIQVRGKPAADGPRYKALGNSMAVPVVRWIGERIEMVDSLLKQQSKS